MVSLQETSQEASHEASRGTPQDVALQESLEVAQESSPDTSKENNQSAELPLGDDIPFPSIVTSSAPDTTATESNGGVDGAERPRTRSQSQSHGRRSIRDLAYRFESALDLEHSLQTANAKRLFTTFFTINTIHQEAPFYVSELVNEAANPQFKEFDLAALPGVSSRNDTKCVITVWGKPMSGSSFQRIVCDFVDFATLTFIGRSRYSIYSSFPPNSIILALTDGYYLLPQTYAITAPYSTPVEGSQEQLYVGGLYKHSKNLSMADSFYDASPQYTCSFTSIMKLSNLQECIVDANNTKANAAQLISTLLETNTKTKKPVLFALRKKRQELQHKLAVTQQRLTQEKTRITALAEQVAHCKSVMKTRKDYVSSQLSKQRVARRASAVMESSISTDKIVINDDRVQAHVERARIVSDLNEIFPINVIPDVSFKFSICGVPLPDYTNTQPSASQISRALVKDFGVSEEDLIAAAYGFAAQLLTLLSYYLGVPLRYPVQPYGSQSFIIDPISAIQGSRTFPLWSKGSLYFRFQYASFLFNKNIEQLMCSQSMFVADLKPTLANLKNLLLVLSTEPRKEYV